MIETGPKIYKRTSTGAVQEWHRELEVTDEGEVRYRSVSGQVNGKAVKAGWTVVQGKNIGKSNETTPLEQARLEIQADYTKKLAQGGYHETATEIDNAKFFKPMLAKKYEDDFPGFGAKIISQPKLDGVRCIATKDGLWSRQGKPFDAVPHISSNLKPFFDRFPDAVLDGELYADKFDDDFNAIISLVKKKNPTPARLKEAAEHISYHVYDFPSVEGPFDVRYAKLEEYAILDYDCITLVPTTEIEDQDELDAHMQLYVEAGYEGQIIRIANLPYENKRSKQLLKRKDFMDEEFTVVAIEEGKGNRSGMAGYITYRMEDGTEFGSGIKGTHEYCKQLLVDADKYVGGTGTVKFQNYTPDGVPRFPVTIALYEGERDT